MTAPIVFDESNEIRVELHQTLPGPWWDDALRQTNCPLPLIFASSTLIDYWRTQIGYRPYFLVVRNQEDRPVGLLAAQAAHPLARSVYAWRTGPLLTRFGNLLLPRLEWMCPPVIFDADRDIEVHGMLARAVSILQSRFAIPLMKPSPVFILSSKEKSDAITTVWRNIGFVSEKVATLLIDLTLPLDALFANLHNTARNKIRKSESQGIRILRVDGPEGLSLERYLQVTLESKKLFSTGQRLSESFQDLWCRCHHGAGSLEFFLAEHEGQPAGGMGIYHFGGYVTQIQTFTTAYAIENKIPGGDAIKWEAIKYAKAMGNHYYDLTGIAVNPSPGSKAESIRRFKEKWGGCYTEYALVHRQLRSPRAICYNALLALKRKY